MTTTEQIDGFLERYAPEVQKEGRAARRALRRLMPTATELVYDNYNALVFAFGSTERASDIVLSIALYPRWVTLFFLHGTSLNDPEGLLEGKGTAIRGVRLVGGAKDLEKKAVRALIAEAIVRAPVALPEKGRGVTVVKSVSKKQRPRVVVKKLGGAARRPRTQP